MRCLLPCVFALLVAASAPAQEAVVKSKIVSVGLFKNGLVIVKREVQVPGAGTFRLDAMPEPVHGSFWIEANTRVEASVKMRDVETPMLVEGGVKPQSDLAGKKVTLHFRNEKIPSVTGTLVKLAKPELPEGPIGEERAALVEQFWILKTAKGRLYVNPADIALMQVDDADEKITQRKPVLILDVAKGAKKPVVHIAYLSNGLAWAPSYQVDVSDKKTLSIEMATVIRNELVDLHDAEMKLISGSASVEFANVMSPLSARTTLAYFFDELGGGNRRTRDAQVVFQNAALTFNTVGQKIGYASGGGEQKPTANADGEGVDLHFESIGKRTLLRDEALSLSIAKAQASYERIVEWTVGTSPVAKKHGGERSNQKDELWDVLLFKNPFKFPMTTAPAMVVANGKFNGQRTSFWTDVGEESSLRVTKALSIRTHNSEQADAKPTERVVVDDRNYSKIYLKGELTMTNHRNQPVELHVRHAIRGVISDIEGTPKLTTREESLEDINRVHEAMWVVNLKPAEERKLSYKYSVLVYR